MHDYNDLERCMASLDTLHAAYFVRDIPDGKQLIHYSPYVSLDHYENTAYVRCYVYHWCDTYDADGNFIDHKVYEGTYTTELDKTI